MMPMRFVVDEDIRTLLMVAYLADTRGLGCYPSFLFVGFFRLLNGL